jgi:hypothetical protein
MRYGGEFPRIAGFIARLLNLSILFEISRVKLLAFTTVTNIQQTGEKSPARNLKIGETLGAAWLGRETRRGLHPRGPQNP